MSQRTERVDELLRQEIGEILAREVADPRIGFATITEVETTPDLRHAKVWVSVIGQPAERDAAIAALRHAMPFVRHELGRRLRIRRIPDLHVQLDDTAERGTRILQLLAELETGSGPGWRRGRSPNRCRRRSPRLHQPDDLDRGAAVGRPAARAAAAAGPPSGRSAGLGAQVVRPCAAEVDAVTVDLGRYVDAVPQSVVDRLRGARRVLAVGHENPDADTLGATLGVVRLVEANGALADPVCTDPIPPLYDFLDGVERFRTDPDPAAPYDLLVISDCGSLERIGDVADRHAELFARLPRVIIDHHASNDADGEADWIDPRAAATCEMVAILATRLGLPLDAGGGGLAAGLMAGIVMDTATFAHPNATPRTLVVAAALVEAGAPLAEISRRLYRSKPDVQLRLFGTVLDRLESSDEGRIVWSSLTEADLTASGATRAHSEGIIDLLSQADAAEVTILFKEAGPETRVSVRTKPGGVDATVLTGRFGGGGHARAAGATVTAPLAEARPPVLAEARRLVAELAR